MLRPTQCIKNGTDLIRRRGFAPCFGDFKEVFFTRTANGGHHIERVARIMFFQQLPYAAWMLQRGIGFGIAAAVQLVIPRFIIVFFLGLFVAREHTFVKIKTFRHNKAGVGIGFNIFPLDFIVLNQPVNQRT